MADSSSITEVQPEPENPHKTGGLKRVYRAFFYSLEGIGSSLKHESAFRQEVILAVLLIPAAFLLNVSAVGKAMMISSIFLVLIVELLNSALEWTIDYISMESHPFAKRVKDMASGAVFLSLVHVPIVWGLVINHAYEQNRSPFERFANLLGIG